MRKFLNSLFAANPHELKQNLKSFFRADAVVAFILFAIYFLTRGYTYGWDDQVLEIPLLKSLIDPTLYHGDYYIESLKVNFVSFLYPLLSKIITTKQIPACYFILYVLVRYYFLFFMYKFWRVITKERFIAFICTVAFLTVGRVPEFLYRTFSHQELALALVMAGFYFFYKERFVWAAVAWGAGANFHFLYCFFPMSYMGLYLILEVRKHSFKTLLKASAAFLLASLPVIIWILKKRFLAPPIDVEAAPVSLLDTYARCGPQVIIFQRIPIYCLLTNTAVWLREMRPYLFILTLFGLNTVFHEDFKGDIKARALCLAGALYLTTTAILTYLHPTRLLFDLNLVRNNQFLLFLLIGYTVIFLYRLALRGKFLTVAATGAAMIFLNFNDYIAMLGLLMLSCVLLGNVASSREKKKIYFVLKFLLWILAAFFFASAVRLIINQYPVSYQWLAVLVFALPLGFLTLANVKHWGRCARIIRILILIIPLVVRVIHLGTFHINHIEQERHGGGFWKLQRDWVDMQKHVRDNTPKDALLMVPYDMIMGGFRIFSERSIICSARDHGIVTFDYNATMEWYRRKADIEPFRVRITSDISPAIKNAIMKYNVDYIVFMRYASPGKRAGNIFQKIYENQSFSLYKVRYDQYPALQHLRSLLQTIKP